MLRDGAESKHSTEKVVRLPEHGGLDEEEEENDSVKSSICCLQGCLAATVVGFSFLVGLPSGILLMYYASKNRDAPLMSVGAVLVALPLLMLIIVTILCLSQRQISKLRKRKVRGSKVKVTTDGLKFTKSKDTSVTDPDVKVIAVIMNTENSYSGATNVDQNGSENRNHCELERF